MRARAVCAGAVASLALVAIVGYVGSAHAEDRTLSFKQLHTGETLTVTFKHNGRYDSDALKKINYILRDWRRNESTTMDPALLDLVWEVKKAVGSTAPISVLCGYRSPVTNAMLRSRSRGVAQNSQHMVGKAMDFFLPDVPLQKLRETALKFQRGGVGYYPTSGSPFVHLDTGNPRMWPRMTRQQLAKLFPDGKTVLIPSDGKPMPGYNEAVAEMKRGITTQMASLSGRSRQQFVSNYPRLDPSVRVDEASVARSTGSSGSGGRNLIASLFESGENGDEEGASNAPETPAAADAEPTVVASLSPADAPLPRTKPAGEVEVPLVEAAEIPTPAPKPMVVLASLEPAAEPATEPQEIAADVPMPDEKPLITASVSPASMTVAALPRERPLLTGSDAIGSLIAGNAKSLEPEQTSATALAATGTVPDMAPFAATFTGPHVELRDGPVLVAIDYRPEALKPYMDSDNCLRGATFVTLRHPDQNDIGALTALSGPVVVNQFAQGPQIAYPMRKFTGPAVVPVATRTYQVASLETGPAMPITIDRTASLR